MKNYNEAIAHSVNEPVVVMFTSKTCGPCKMMKPIVERLAEELSFPLVMIDADESMGLLIELGIRAVPAIVTLKGQQVTGKFAGGKVESQIRSNLALVGIGAGK